MAQSDEHEPWMRTILRARDLTIELPNQVSCRNTEQRALPADRQRTRLTVNELSAVRTPHLPDLLAKKSRSTSELANLGMQTIDLALTVGRAVTISGLESLRCLKLLLPGVDLFWLYLVTLGQIGHRRPASIFRLVLFVIFRSVCCDGTSASERRPSRQPLPVWQSEHCAPADRPRVSTGSPSRCPQCRHARVPSLA